MSRRRRKSGKVDRTTVRYGDSPVDDTDVTTTTPAEPRMPTVLEHTAIDEAAPDLAIEAPAPPDLSDSTQDYDDREDREQHTVGLVARYFKLTLAMVCLNVVVAGANVAMLFRQSSEPRTILVPQPAPSATQPTMAAEPKPLAPPVAPVAPPVLLPVESSSEAPSQVPLLGKEPVKVPLLGKPVVAPRPRTNIAPASDRPAVRVVASLPRTKPAIASHTADAEELPEGSRLAERW